MHNFHTTFVEKSKIVEYSSLGKKHIALVGGGMSAEREVSLSSTNGVAQSLINNGYKVTFIDMGADIATVLQALKPDLVFNCLHGTFGEDGCLPGLLNILRIPYTHSGLLASAIAFSKPESKAHFVANNIPIAKSILVNKKDNIKSDALPRPYVIKPLTQGSSIGVELVFEGDEFNFADYNFPYGDEIIIEEHISGREMQVAVLNGKALGALEIKLLQGKRFYDYETKYTPGFAEHLLPAPLPKNLYDRLLMQAEIVYKIIGCRGLARVEFIYSPEKDEFFILELNTHPGMTPLSICPEIAAYAGISFENLVEELIKTASYDP